MFERRRRKAAIKRLSSPEGREEIEKIVNAKNGECVRLSKIMLRDLKYLPPLDHTKGFAKNELGST